MRDRTVIRHLLAMAALSVLGLLAACSTAPPAPGQASAVPGAPPGTAVACAGLVTAEQVGDGPYAQFGIAGKLDKGLFQRYESQGYVLCHYAGPDQDQGSALPAIDIRYLFDAATGELVLTHLEWKNTAGGQQSGSCVPAPRCGDYVTAERIGNGVFERYGIAEKLHGGQFEAMCSRGVFDCLTAREVGGVEVLGDELLYEIDMASREVSFWRIQWREDLLEPIPSIQVSRDEAEVLVGGSLGNSHLHLISPDDSLPFDPWLGSSWDSGYTQPDKSVYYHPCWFIFSHEGAKLTKTCTTVVDAVTGEIVRRHCGPES